MLFCNREYMPFNMQTESHRVLRVLEVTQDVCACIHVAISWYINLPIYSNINPISSLKHISYANLCNSSKEIPYHK